MTSCNDPEMANLIAAYELIRESTDGEFDAESVARAELAWWVARRDRQQNSAENAGKLIARLYAELYSRTNEGVERAGLLRAQAAVLRDQGGINADWQMIEQLLIESYRELVAATK